MALFAADWITGDFESAYQLLTELEPIAQARNDPVVVALVRSGRHEAAARLLGGLLELPGRRSDTEQIGALVEPELAEVLGPAPQRLPAEGRKLGRSPLAELAIAEFDRLLPDAVSA